MPYKERKTLIQKIEEKRSSKILTYFLSDRKEIPEFFPSVLKANIEQDAKEVFFEVLRKIGHQPRIDLFINTRGGDTNAVWPVVSLIREFCDEFQVLVPFRSHSAGTMICLGADKIVMSRIGELSPIDPTTGNAFNPIDEGPGRGRKGISVEDLRAYKSLAEDVFGLEQTALLDVFKELTKVVHPLALGNVNRVLSQSELLSKKLLSLHLDDKERIGEITKALTVEFYSHLHFINRREAKTILGEDMVVDADEELESEMMDLYRAYVNVLEMDRPFFFVSEMGMAPSKPFTFLTGIIESNLSSFVFKRDFVISQRPQLPPNMQMVIQPGQPLPPNVQAFPRGFHSEPTSAQWIINATEA